MAESIKIIMATDGSEAAIDAARRSMDLLRPHAHVAVVMVIPEHEDPMEDAGGIEGPVITDEGGGQGLEKVDGRGTIRPRSDGGGART